MRLRRRGTAEEVADDAPPVEASTIYGYECPCGKRIENPSERQLNEDAWAHAHRCRHDDHVDARALDPTYGHPDHFNFDDGSPA